MSVQARPRPLCALLPIAYPSDTLPWAYSILARKPEDRIVRRVSSVVVALVLVVSVGQPLTAQPSRGALSRGTIAITNVNVVPMTTDSVIRDATVIVRDGRIVAVGPSRRAG